MISLCFASFQEFYPIHFPSCFQATSKALSLEMVRKSRWENTARGVTVGGNSCRAGLEAHCLSQTTSPHPRNRKGEKSDDQP